VGAEFRPPSDCEAKFDTDLRATLRRAFEPVVGALLAKNWIQEQGRAKEWTGVARSIQKEPYRPDFTNMGGFGIALKGSQKR
jgi:hypothetical protein